LANKNNDGAAIKKNPAFEYECDIKDQWERSRECKLLDFCFLEIEDLFNKVGYKNWNRRTYDMFFHAGIDKDSSIRPEEFIKLYRKELISQK
jgi:hypothetical protein